MEHNTEEEVTLFKRSLPYLQLFLAIVSVSFSAIIVVFLLAEGVPPEVTAMYRTFFAGIGALIFSLYKKKFKWIGKKSTISRYHWILFSGFLLAVHFATWFISLDYVNVAISTTMVDTVPIFLAIFGFIFFKEKIKTIGILGIAIAFTGGILLAFFSDESGSTQTNLLLGITFSLIGALTVTFYFLIGKKILQDSPLWPYFALVNLSSSIFLLVYNLIRNYELFRFQNPALVYGLFIVSALGPSLIGHATYNYSLRKLPAYVVGVAILGEPIGATILAVLIFPSTQTPDPITILFAVIILLGIVMTSVSQYLRVKLFSRKKEKLEEKPS
ncbi:MAG: DMT family transporter [Candidatus Heimdallarchaeota archaeon]|nr:DMT family transporter [Candidatus Heimdallarchaeota archaeon]